MCSPLSWSWSVENISQNPSVFSPRMKTRKDVFSAVCLLQKQTRMKWELSRFIFVWWKLSDRLSCCSCPRLSVTSCYCGKPRLVAFVMWHLLSHRWFWSSLSIKTTWFGRSKVEVRCLFDPRNHLELLQVSTMTLSPLWRLRSWKPHVDSVNIAGVFGYQVKRVNPRLQTGLCWSLFQSGVQSKADGRFGQTGAACFRTGGRMKAAALWPTDDAFNDRPNLLDDYIIWE